MFWTPFHDGKSFLDALKLTDADVLHSWHSEPELAVLTLGHQLPKNHAAVVNWIEEQQYRRNEITWAIRGQEGGRLVGYIRLSGIDDASGVCELGVFMGALSLHGFGKSSVDLVDTFAKQPLHLQKTWLRVMESNTSTIRLYEERGFQHEGRLRRHYWTYGNYRDVLIMAKFLGSFADSGPGRLTPTGSHEPTLLQDEDDPLSTTQQREKS